MYIYNYYIYIYVYIMCVHACVWSLQVIVIMALLLYFGVLCPHFCCAKCKRKQVTSLRSTHGF